MGEYCKTLRKSFSIDFIHFECWDSVDYWASPWTFWSKTSCWLLVCDFLERHVWLNRPACTTSVFYSTERKASYDSWDLLLLLITSSCFLRGGSPVTDCGTCRSQRSRRVYVGAITHRMLETPKNNRYIAFTRSIKEPRMSYSEFVSELLVMVQKFCSGYADLHQLRMKPLLNAPMVCTPETINRLKKPQIPSTTRTKVRSN